MIIRKKLAGFLGAMALAVAIPYLLVLADEEGWGWLDDTEYETWDDPENYLEEEEDYENSYPEYEEEEEPLNLEDESGLPEEYHYDQMDEQGNEALEGNEELEGNVKRNPKKARRNSASSNGRDGEIPDSSDHYQQDSEIERAAEEIMQDSGDIEENEEEYDIYGDYDAEAEYDGEGEDELY